MIEVSSIVTTAIMPISEAMNPEQVIDDDVGAKKEQIVSIEAPMEVDAASNQMADVPNVLDLFGPTSEEAQVSKSSAAPATEEKAEVADETKPSIVEAPNVLDLFKPEEPSETPVMDVKVIPETSAKATSKPRAKAGVDKALKVRDHNGIAEADEKGEGPSRSEASVGKQKRKKVVEEERRPEGPVRKKSRPAPSSAASSESHSSSSKGKSKAVEPQKKVKADGKRRHEEEDETCDAGPQPKAKKQRKTDGTASKRTWQPSHTHSDSSTAPSTSSSKHPVSEPTAPPQKSKARNSETSALDAEICGLLIESMATSRASCLPASSLYKSVMQCRPSLKAQRSEKEWMEVFERVLRDGEASRGSGVFGKVESSGKVCRCRLSFGAMR